MLCSNKRRHGIPSELEEMKLIRNSKKHLETRVPCRFHNKAITYHVAITT